MGVAGRFSEFSFSLFVESGGLKCSWKNSGNFEIKRRPIERNKKPAVLNRFCEVNPQVTGRNAYLIENCLNSAQGSGRTKVDGKSMGIFFSSSIIEKSGELRSIKLCTLSANFTNKSIFTVLKNYQKDQFCRQILGKKMQDSYLKKSQKNLHSLIFYNNTL